MFSRKFAGNGGSSFSPNASSCFRPGKARCIRLLWAFALIVCLAMVVQADTGGNISGTVTDQSGSVVPDTTVTVLNLDTTVQQTTKTNTNGFYNFAALPVGRYEIEIVREGFKPYKRTGLVIDINSELRADVSLSMGEQSEEVVVSGTAVSVETVDTNLGDVVSGAQIVTIPLNGRSYTDLLSIQPGVSPVTSLTSTSVIMSGVTGTINPSGDQNPGNVSINGQRESSNGFFVNGIDVKEYMNGGTSILPNLDSISEFRLLTDNFDPEYGNYNGGLINVVTKSGSDSFHGDAFEFLRNTALDAKNYFAATRSEFKQNQFGGTVGGPIKKQKIFFFGDYQGTRTNQGITSPVISVPSLADRQGNLMDIASSLNGTVDSTGRAAYLDSEFGYAPNTVFVGEHYYTPGCTNTSQCVLPNATIPMSTWSAPAKNLLKYIPTPSNTANNTFSTSAFSQAVRDDKGSAHIDANTRWGQISGYYFIDNYRLDNPYPGGQGGASVPGFDALTIGRAQVFTVSDTKVIGMNTVDEFHVGIIRNSNIIGQPHGGLGVSLASQGFATGPHSTGIEVQAPQYEGVMNLVFPSFVMGVPVTNTNQWNNTLYGSDTLSKVVGDHSIKFGGEFHIDQVNEHPNATFNGTFNFANQNSETGSAFANFLLGVPSQYTQSTGQPFYLRNRYFGAFGEDSWRVRPGLTLNYGVRWDVIRPWSEKYNNIQTVVPGRQSVLYPNAIPGLLVPGDPGIPSTLSPTKYDKFAPRIGMAYAPKFDHGILRAIFGKDGDSSIRASFGMFYTAFPGLSAGVMYSVPPFGYNYLSPQAPLFATPFVNAADPFGAANTNPYPIVFPPHNVSAGKPYTAFDWSAVTPISADPYFYYRNTVPYIENYMLSIQRQITAKMLLTASYVGNQGHHILTDQPSNLGNPTLCLSLSKPSEVAQGSPTCGPYAEDGTFTSASGQVYYGTRRGLLGSTYNGVVFNGTPTELYGNDTAQKTIENSNYNALETTLRYSWTRTTVSLAYTYSKSIDQGSNLGEVINPYNPALSRNVSAWDMRHNFVATYNYSLPLERLFHRTNRMTEGWSISGTTRFSTGFPVTLYDQSDSSLQGSLGNGVNNQLIDTPVFTPGSLNINTNPRNGRPEFNTSLFQFEAPGQVGNAARRSFYGPGINNFDLQVSKNVRITESKSVDIRVEAFNVFNHAQFYGPSAVDGEVENKGTPTNPGTFGTVVSAADPRLIQLAAKFYF
jgi:hypothetical protein